MWWVRHRLRRPSHHSVTGDRGGHIDGFLQAAIGLFQGDAQVIAQVRSARRALTRTAATTAAHEIAEEIVEHVREGRSKIALTAAKAAAGPRPATGAALECGMAEAVISGLLVGIFQDIIGLARFLELLLGVGVVLVAVGVKFLGLLAIGLLDLVGRRALGKSRELRNSRVWPSEISFTWSNGGRWLPPINRRARLGALVVVEIFEVGVDDIVVTGTGIVGCRRLVFASSWLAL